MELINEWISNPKNEPGTIDWLIDLVLFCDQQRTVWTLVWHQAVERKMTTKMWPLVSLHLMTRTTNRWPGLVLGFRLLLDRWHPHRNLKVKRWTTRKLSRSKLVRYKVSLSGGLGQVHCVEFLGNTVALNGDSLHLCSCQTLKSNAMRFPFLVASSFVRVWSENMRGVCKKTI